MPKQTLSAIVLLSCCLGTIGCSGGGSEEISANPSPPAYVVFGNLQTFQQSGGRTPLHTYTLAGFAAQSNGILTHKSDSDLPTQGMQIPKISAIPAGRFIFSLHTDSSGSFLKGFIVDKMTATASPSCTAIPLPGRIVQSSPAVVPHETFLYVSSDAVIDIFHIDAKGCPAFSGTQSGIWPVVVMATSPNNKWVFMLYQIEQQAKLQSNSINPTSGALAPIGDFARGPIGISCSHMQVHPSVGIIYLACPSTLSDEGLVVIYKVAPDGTISEGGAQLFNLRVLAIHPSGNFLYGIEPLSNALLGFSINQSTGGLTSLQKAITSIGLVGNNLGSGLILSDRR